MATYRTREGDMLDAICLAYYGRSTNVTELVLDVNPGLAQYGGIYPSGLNIILPDDIKEKKTSVIQLWD